VKNCCLHIKICDYRQSTTHVYIFLKSRIFRLKLEGANVIVMLNNKELYYREKTNNNDVTMFTTTNR